MNERYITAKQEYEKIGVDVEKALNILKDIPVSMHCWQGDDVIGLTMTDLLPEEFRQQEIIREKPKRHRNLWMIWKKQCP